MSAATHSESRDHRFPLAVPDHVALVELCGDGNTPPSLHPEEEALIHPRATRTRRNDFRLGRAAAHAALLRIGADVGPVLQGDGREPTWPAGIVGSIAHGSGIAIAAVARVAESGGIGLDVEHVSRFFPALPEQIAFEEERSRLHGLECDVRPYATLEIFSAKESIYKAFYPRVRRYFGFEAVRISPAGEGLLHARFVAPLDPSYDARIPLPVQYRWNGDMVATFVEVPVAPAAE